MFRIYSAAKIAQLLSESGGPITIKLGWYDAAWRPHPSSDRYAPAISGPAQKVTYTATDDRQLVVDVERKAHFLTLAFAPPMEHSVGPMPTVGSSSK
jgi:hypothetical protein